jgi:hypothetical protein
MTKPHVGRPLPDVEKPARPGPGRRQCDDPVNRRPRIGVTAAVLECYSTAMQLGLPFAPTITTKSFVWTPVAFVTDFRKFQ